MAEQTNVYIRIKYKKYGKIYEENFKEIIECLKTLEIEIKKILKKMIWLLLQLQKNLRTM